jgi:positive regulator of sigma E activity
MIGFSDIAILVLAICMVIAGVYVLRGHRRK